MKLGILLAGRRPEDIAKRLEAARAAGYSLCQLNLMQGGFTRADVFAIADAMSEYGIRPLAVGCYVNPLKPDDPSLTGVTRADLDLLLQSLDVMGARRIVFWSGTAASGLYDECEENDSEESLRKAQAFVQDVVRNTRARRYELVIEPWRTHVLSSVARVEEFHSGLDPITREKVRYVVDACSLITEAKYPERDRVARSVCHNIGEAGAVFHLRDCMMPPDGETGFPPPGQGTLDYEAYIQEILDCAPPESPAIVRNVPPDEYAAVRDYLLRISEKWELV